MPSTKDDRLAIYQECYQQLGLDSSTVARLTNLGEQTRSHRHKVDDKIKGREGRGITKTEALLMQLLVRLQDDGYNLADMTFDNTGRITQLNQD